MNLDQLLTLISAGFTKQEILAMQSTILPTTTSPTPTPQRVTQAHPQASPNVSAQSPTQLYSDSGLQQNAQPFINPQNIQQGQPNIFGNGQGYDFGQGQGYGQMLGTTLERQGQNSAQMGNQNGGQDLNILQAIQNLTSAVQMGNVNNMQNQVPKQTTTEDAIASIINPTWDGLEDKVGKE